MNQRCLEAMSTPFITARGGEFRDVMADLNSGLRYAFNLTPSQPEKKTQSWSSEDHECVFFTGCDGVKLNA